MLAILLQIVGTILLVYSSVSKRLPEIGNAVKTNLSIEGQKNRIEGIYQETWLNRFGFSYLLVGMIFSIQEISAIPFIVYLNSSYLICFLISGVLVLIGFVLPNKLKKLRDDEVIPLIESRQNGDIWIE